MSVSSHVLGPALLAVATSACLLIHNPGFDDGEGEGATSTSTSTDGPTPTSTTGTTGTTTGLTGATGSDSDATTTTPTTGAVEPATDTGSTTGEPTTATSTGDTTTGACAGAPEDLCEPIEILGAPYLACEQGRSWSQARAVCEDHCMHLVVLDEPESAAMHAVLVARMTDADKTEAMTIDTVMQVSSPRASWWIGGYKQGTWTWLDGAPMPPVSQGGWAGNNPDINGDDACAAIALFAKGADDGKWFDRACDEVPYRFVCEPA